MAYNVDDIANKIILNTDVEKGDIISNLKLQKLLYYMEGYHLAFFESSLFEDPIEAWTYGPVVTKVYHRFKANGPGGLELEGDISELALEEEEEDMFSQVMNEYGKFNAIKLMEMTHRELPWKEAFDKPDKRINRDSMKNYFKTMIDGEEEN